MWAWAWDGSWLGTGRWTSLQAGRRVRSRGMGGGVANLLLSRFFTALHCQTHVSGSCSRPMHMASATAAKSVNTHPTLPHSCVPACRQVQVDKNDLVVYRLCFNRFNSHCHGWCGCDNRTWAQRAMREQGDTQVRSWHYGLAQLRAVRRALQPRCQAVDWCSGCGSNACAACTRLACH